MKRFIFILFLFSGFYVFAGHNIYVNVEIRTKEVGKLYVSLIRKSDFDSKTHTYFKGRVLGESKIKEGKIVKVTFENIPKGTYGIQAYIDSNGNRKHDMRGLNLEPWGTSFSIRPGIRAPKWKEIKFNLDKDMSFSFFVKEGISKK